MTTWSLAGLPTNRFGHRFTCLNGANIQGPPLNFPTPKWRFSFITPLNTQKNVPKLWWCHHSGMSSPSWWGKNIPLHQLVVEAPNWNIVKLDYFHRVRSENKQQFETTIWPVVTKTEFRVSVIVILMLLLESSRTTSTQCQRFMCKCHLILGFCSS